jgi:hypothetical protein
MRSKQIIKGLKNSQKIRVILNGVGFYTTVQGATEMCFTDQRVTVWNALEVIGREKLQGYGGSNRVYDEKMIPVTIGFQINLV